MNRNDIIRFHSPLKNLLYQLKLLNLTIITLVILLYLIAIYCLLKEQLVLAVVFASIAALSFHLSQRYMISGVKSWLQRDDKKSEMLDFLEREMQQRLDKNKSDYSQRGELRAFFALLDKAIKIIEER